MFSGATTFGYSALTTSLSSVKSKIKFSFHLAVHALATKRLRAKHFQLKALKTNTQNSLKKQMGVHALLTAGRFLDFDLA